MSRQFQAVYEQGLLRPLQPLALAERQLVTLSLQESDRSSASATEAISSQQSGWEAFVARMEALPNTIPADGRSNRDHDELIYGD